ncbi:hypothetical protein AB1Y20_019803 [Prymnesium parvum]|uniref:Fringe-like glycosyltransferase domain-containing protein n=1 Tax=Prymnesium parvum TaxID=97485 RepID=A0AB34JW02_PRYPA
MPSTIKRLLLCGTILVFVLVQLAIAATVARRRPQAPPPPSATAVAPPSSPHLPPFPLRPLVAPPSRRLPRGVPCTEFADLDAAYVRCHGASATPLVHCPRATSMETACVMRPAEVDVSCGSVGSTSLEWKDVVFAVATYNSEFEREMLQVGAETWLPLVSGADLVLGIDADDPRPDEYIKPKLKRAAHDVHIHVYRCPVCCSGGRKTPGSAKSRSEGAAGMPNSPCPEPTEEGKAVVREGWKARSKVMYLFLEVGRMFGGGAGGRAAKRYLLKVDADATLHPHHLLSFLRRYDEVVGSSEPSLFGMAACRSKKAERELCHAGGGAAYGLTFPAVATLAEYMRKAYPRFLKEADNGTYGGEDVIVAFALKHAAGVSVVNCGAFHQHRADQYMFYRMDTVPWPSSATPVSFHHFRSTTGMRSFFKCAMYDLSTGQPRCFYRDADVFLRSQTMKCPKHNSTADCNASAVVLKAAHQAQKFRDAARSAQRKAAERAREQKRAHSAGGQQARGLGAVGLSIGVNSMRVVFQATNTTRGQKGVSILQARGAKGISDLNARIKAYRAHKEYKQAMMVSRRAQTASPQQASESQQNGMRA